MIYGHPLWFFAYIKAFNLKKLCLIFKTTPKSLKTYSVKCTGKFFFDFQDSLYSLGCLENQIELSVMIDFVYLLEKNDLCFGLQYLKIT